MRYFNLVLLICSVAAAIILSSIIYETGGVLEASAVRSVYKGESSLLFLFQMESSFYSIYPLVDGPADLQLRKAAHFFAYGFLAAVIYCLVTWAPFWQRGAAAVASSSLIGTIDEIHQHFLLNRSGRLLDIFINLAGSVTAVLLIMGLVAFLSFIEAKFPENQEHSQL
ncbi:VanZ family protein [Evansella sp. LMS18]|uniref:VanZ family protein n=1 Tax=Evansella sp. LMS18 TaxID=2924033 RepID=UPI0020D0A254|nr:VanZ family protein [Evansella sp. LMS18]UTR11999.1 VanZ family protein [Evansella sp. LMS18]